jgi:hypothetical protein
VQSGHRIGTLCSDNRAKYKSKLFNQFYIQHNIHRQFSQVCTPTQNGTVGRMNRTLIETARCLSFKTWVPLFLWPETISTATYLINRHPASKLGHRTPHKLFTKKKHDLQNLRISGSIAYVLIHKQKHGKMAPKSRKAIMVGYDLTSKCYRCYAMTLVCEPKDASLRATSGNQWAWEHRIGRKILFLDSLIQK